MPTGHDDVAPYGRWFSLFSGTLESEIELPMVTGSMAPSILPGDRITIRPMGGKRPHRGDIIVFRRDGAIVAHRLVFVLYAFAKAILLEMGDANRTAGFVKPESLIGTVVAVKKREGIVRASRHDARGLATSILWRRIIRRIPVAILEKLVRRVRRHA